MEQAPTVRTGWFDDYSASGITRHQYTLGEVPFVFWQLTIGVAAGAAWPWLSLVLIRIWHWFQYWRSHTPRQPPIEPQSVEPQPDQPQHRGIKRLGEGIALTFQRTNWFSLLALILAVAFAYVLAYTTSLPMGHSGLTRSDQCGSWTLKEDAGPDREASYDVIKAEKESRAARYAKDCYGQPSATSPDQCNFFQEAKVFYDVSDPRYFDPEYPCPFNRTFCAEPDRALRLSTGRVSARVIGINSPKPPDFNRTTICTPLNLKGNPDHFVARVPEDTPSDYPTYVYDLGKKGADGDTADNYTLRTRGWAFDWDLSGYSVSVFESTPSLVHDFWEPRDELKRPNNTYLSMVFVRSSHIFYKGPSTDFIFPANQEYDPVELPGLYYNNDPRARPLACVDWIEICKNGGGDCTPANIEDETAGVEYEYLRMALRKSNTFHAVQYGLGAALAASSVIGDFVSNQLPHDQWIVECQGFFDTSLARIQFDALDIAEGLGSDESDYEEDTPTWAQNKLCGMYKFQLPKGYNNLAFWPTFLALLLPFLLWLLHLKVPGTKFNADQEMYFKGDWMVWDGLIWCIYAMVVSAVSLRKRLAQNFHRESAARTSPSGPGSGGPYTRIESPAPPERRTSPQHRSPSPERFGIGSSETSRDAGGPRHPASHSSPQADSSDNTTDALPQRPPRVFDGASRNRSG